MDDIKSSDNVGFDYGALDNLIFDSVLDLQLLYPYSADNPITNEELCTVGSDHAVITWVTPGSSDTTIHIGENPGQLTKDNYFSSRQYHWVEVNNLKPSTRYWYRVESGGAIGPLNSFTTMPKPEGNYLFSFAIITDTHISEGESAGDINEIFFGKLLEYAGPLLAQCILDCKKRGIELAVIPGDLTDTASRGQYLAWRDKLLPYFENTPVLLCTGNHDKYTKGNGIGVKGFLEYVAWRERAYTSMVWGEHNFIIIDSCRENNDWGYIEPEQLRWLEDELKRSKGSPSFLFLHHPCNGLDVWFGVKNYGELRKIISKYPDVRGVFSGHIHRNKVTTNRLLTRNLPYVQVPATVQFPCGYAIVRVYENGFEYNSYKVSRLDLSEMSRRRFILKNKGNSLFTWYAFGGIDDRSLSYVNGRLYRPRQYEVSVVAGHEEAGAIYNKLRALSGAILAPAAAHSKVKVILGRFDSPLLAKSQRLAIARYGVRAFIYRDGGYDVPKEIKRIIT